MLEKNRDNLAKALPGLRKYQMTQGETVSNGFYYNAFVPNLQPAQLLQPFLDYAFGFRRGVNAGQPPDKAGPRAELPFPVNGIPGDPDEATRKRLATWVAVLLAVVAAGRSGVLGAPDVLRAEDDHRVLPDGDGHLSRRRGAGLRRRGRHHRERSNPRARRPR